LPHSIVLLVSFDGVDSCKILNIVEYYLHKIFLEYSSFEHCFCCSVVFKVWTCGLALSNRVLLLSVALP
jgi:hypothetical protein